MIWIEVVGGPGPLWVQCDECRLENGDLAFVNVAGPTPPLPAWFRAPASSSLRKSEDMRGSGFPRLETRSMRGDAVGVLTFYQACMEQGGLLRTDETQKPQFGRPTPGYNRAVPGFHAENTRDAFSIDIYEHGGLAFWTIELLSLGSRRKAVPNSPLRLVRRNEERVILLNPDTGKECTAPTVALRGFVPQDVKRDNPRREPIVWSSLPEWVQFSVAGESRGDLHRRCGANGIDEWHASVASLAKGDPRAVFESCLDSLDVRGFDASGVQRPERSYCVTVLPGGHSLNADVQSEAGDRASVTLADTQLRIRYAWTGDRSALQSR